MLLVFTSILVSMSATVLGLSCTTNPTPQYNLMKDIEWHCITNTNTTCYTKVMFNDDLIQASPYPTMNALGQTVEGFECNDLCTVKFDSTDLRNARNVTFSVTCGEDTVTETDVRPNLGSAFTSEVTYDRTVWFKNNARYFAGILIMLIIALFLIGGAWQLINRK